MHARRHFRTHSIRHAKSRCTTGLGALGALRVLCVLIGAMIVAVGGASAAAATADDACSLLTPAQVGAAVGATVSEGSYVTPSFKKTCTWTFTGGIVTLMTEGTEAFDAGKSHALRGVVIQPVSGVGDDAYYVVTGPITALIVKKGSVAFKMSLYDHSLPMEKTQGIEKALAEQVVSSL